MRIISATILDATHLELSQPVDAAPGAVIQISLPDGNGDAAAWREAARQHLLEAYADEDAVYDQL